jgi:adenylosuccinate lyase
MIERYSTPEMTELWSEENKFKIWQKVEIALCKAWMDEGVIPESEYLKIKFSSSVDPQRVKELDAKVHHDVIAFLTAWGEQDGLQDAARFIHLGMTSSDLIDTALALQIKEAGVLIVSSLDQLVETVKSIAKEHKTTLTIGRSHGVHAEATTFGLKFANYLLDLRRIKQKLNWAIESISCGMFSGPVGTYSNLIPKIEKLACDELGLEVCPVSTQVISRERHADFLYALASMGAVLEKIATEIRHLQRTEVLEVEEPFYSGQKGSSAMPHKRNPWRSENLCGLARILRSYVSVSLENVALWHERDISHSSTERIMFPDACQVAHFMILRINDILKDLRVYPDNMLKNLNLFGGIVHSQSILLRLTGKGLTRHDAYLIVQENAMKAWNKIDGDFLENLKDDPRIQKHFSETELNSLIEEVKKNEIKHLDEVYLRMGLQ